jgi:hypothetical protein
MVFEKGILSQQYATMFVDLIKDIKDKFKKFETDIGDVVCFAVVCLNFV